MIAVRKAEERGHADHGWLDSWHTFSFADYYDPKHVAFGALRVINEDRVAAGQGFPPHGHRDMEILSYVLEGALEHRDSMGNGSVIRRGDVQRMSAGTGVMHSEYNASAEEPVHFLQVWIVPDARGIAPGYEQKTFGDAEKRGRLRVLASPDGREGSVTIHQDAVLYATMLERGERVTHTPVSGRRTWVQVVRGEIEVNGERLDAGDGAGVSGDGSVTLTTDARGEALLFDLS